MNNPLSGLLRQFGVPEVRMDIHSVAHPPREEEPEGEKEKAAGNSNSNSKAAKGLKARATPMKTSSSSKPALLYKGLTSQEEYDRLRSLKSRGTGEWTKHFTPLFDDGVLKLECGSCKRLFSATNPSRTFNEHSCSKGHRASPSRGGASSAVKAEKGAKAEKPEKAGKGAKATPTTARQLEAVEENLANFFYTSGLSLHLIESPFLKAAIGKAGATLPDSTALTTRLLKKSHKTQYSVVESKLKGQPVQLAAGMWRSNLPEYGDPLLNVFSLHPNGPTFFEKVIRPGGAAEDVDWLVKAHVELLVETSQTRGAPVHGLLMDSNKPSREAMAQLKPAYPDALIVGCVAHSLDLIIKLLAKGELCPGVGLVLSLTSTIARGIRHIPGMAAYMEQHGVQPIPVPGPPLHVSHVATLDAVLQNAQALQLAVFDDGWKDVAGDADDATVMHTAICQIGEEWVLRKFWTAVGSTVELLRPLRDTVDQLERERPRVSQVYGMWDSLEEHIIAWKEAMIQVEPDLSPLADGVLELFAARRLVHHDAWFTAAAFLDPMNFVEQNQRWMPPQNLLGDKCVEEVKHVAMMFGGESAAIKEVDRFRFFGVPTQLSTLVDLLGGLRADGTRDKLAPPQDRRMLWDTHLAAEFPILSQVAQRGLSMHATGCAGEKNSSVWGKVFNACRTPLSMDRAQKVIYIRQNLKAEEQDSDQCVAAIVARLDDPTGE